MIHAELEGRKVPSATCRPTSVGTKSLQFNDLANSLSGMSMCFGLLAWKNFFKFLFGKLRRAADFATQACKKNRSEP